MEKVKFPEIAREKSGSLEKILSIRVLECDVILVGRVIWGKNKFEVKILKKLFPL